MQHDCDEQRVARFVPVIAAFMATDRINKDVSNILDIADFELAFTHFKQWVVARGGLICRIKPDAGSKLRAPAGRQLPVLALDVMNDGTACPRQKRRHDQSHALT